MSTGRTDRRTQNYSPLRLTSGDNKVMVSHIEFVNYGQILIVSLRINPGDKVSIVNIEIAL